MPRRTPDGPQELTEHAKDSKPYDPELTPVKPKAEVLRAQEPQAEVLDLLNERVSTYEDGAVIERLGVGGGTEKWTVNSIDDRGTIFLTSESGKRAMMHETEVALEERAATFAPQLDAAWGKTVDTVAEMTDEDDVTETAAMLKELRGDILLLAAERLAASPDADPARALLGAVYDVQKRIEEEKKTANEDRNERAEIQAAKEYLGFSPADANALADAENMLGTLRFGSYDPSVVDRGAPFVDHTKTLSSPQLENIAAARATVAEIAVLDPDLRDDILGNIPDALETSRSLADIDAELKTVDDHLSLTEQQWRAHGKGGPKSAEATVHLTVTRNLREREKRLMAERRIAVTAQTDTRANEITAPHTSLADEVTVAREQLPVAPPSGESEDVTLRLPPRRGKVQRTRTIARDEGRGQGKPAPFIAMKTARELRMEEITKMPPIAKARSAARLQERMRVLKPETYVAPDNTEPFRAPDRPTTPTRKNRGITENEWMEEGDQANDLRAFETVPKMNPEWYRKFAKDFGGAQDFQRMHAEARARTKNVTFTLEDLKHSNPITRWFYKRQMAKAVKEMVRQDAAKSKKKRGGLQA